MILSELRLYIVVTTAKKISCGKFVGEDANKGKKQAAGTFFDLFLHDTMESRIKRMVRIYTDF
jgi:hypothetical protein